MDDTEGTPQDTTTQALPALDRQAGGPPPEGIVEDLAGAAPWARFIAILGFIGVGFMLLVGFGILVVGFPGEMEAIPLRFVGLVYILIAAVYLIPVLPLNRFAAAAGRLRRERTYEVAAEALRHNRVFWRRLGILSIVGVVFTVLMLFVAVFVGLLASVMNR